MSELDKYFEKARKSEPLIENGDAKKILAGKLSDGGIATNLYNKIKVYPMITTLITSVATIATVVLLQLTTVKNIEPPADQPPINIENANSQPTSETANYVTVTEKSDNIASDSKKEQSIEKKTESAWETESIDVKSVNTLKLSPQQLSELGITVGENQFKVNAFDKYQYIIYKNNDKKRDYYNANDRDALPTPAMVTTATGFKSLTLFKRGNVEAIVDRKRSISDEKITEQTISSTEYNSEQKLDIDISPDNATNFNLKDGSYNEYKESLSGNKDSAEIIREIEKFESLELEMNGKTMSLDIKQLLENSNLDSNLSTKDFAKILELGDGSTELDGGNRKMKFSVKLNKSDEEDALELMTLDYDVQTEDIEDNNDEGIRETKDLVLRTSDSSKVIQLRSTVRQRDKNNKMSIASNRNVNLLSTNLDIKDIDAILQTSLDSLDNRHTTLVEVEDNSEITESDNQNKRTIRMPLESLGKNKKIKIIDGEPAEFEESVITEVYKETDDKNYQESEESNSSLEDKKYEIELDGKTFSIDINDLIKDGKLDQNKYKEFILSISKDIDKNIKVDSRLSGLESKKIEQYQLNINANGEESNQSILLEKLEYNINELIPIEISFDGEKTDFIVWYEATEDFLNKLPTNELEKINPELLALVEQNNHCENEPIEKDKAVMDVWSGCSGAIKGMRVFPNPASLSSNVEFELEENRVLSIAVYDLSGKLIKKIRNSLSLNKGKISESLNLSGIYPGLYYIVLKSERNEQALQRIIIE